MVKTNLLLLSCCFLSLLAMAQQAKEVDVQQLFEKGFFMETVERNLDGAIRVYEAVVALNPQDQHLLALTNYQLAGCWEKKGNKKKADAMYRELVSKFPDEKELIQNVKKHLSEPRSVNTPEQMAQMFETIVSVDFEEAPVVDFFDFLRNRLNIDIVLTSEYQTDTPPLSISVSELKIINLLHLVLDMTQGDFALLHGALIIGQKHEIAEIRHREWPDVGNVASPAQIVEQKLKSTQCSMDFSGTPVHQVIAFCKQTFNINIVVYPKIENRLMSFRVTDTSCLNALRLICIVHGDLAYGYKDGVVFFASCSQYTKMTEENKKSFVPLAFRITYDVPPPQGYPACKAYFVDGSGVVRMMDVSPESQFQIVPGAYKLNFDLPGYFYGKSKDINIEKTSPLFVIEEKLFVVPRNLSFELEDTSTGELVSADKILVNGKIVMPKDTFKPGTTLDITIECKDYKTYNGQIALQPGKGPFVIKASLQKKKN